MTVLQSNVISTARKAKGTGENLVVTSSPGLDPAKPMPAFAGGKFLVMGKDTREPEAAALFMEHILSPEAQLINARIASEPPSRRSVLNDPWFSTPEAADLKVALEYMAAHPHAFRYHEKHNRLADIIAVETQQMVSNRKPIGEALDAMAKQWQEALKG
jgi:multiple sugar transport system substrate-binding protein